MKRKECRAPLIRLFSLSVKAKEWMTLDMQRKTGWKHSSLPASKFPNIAYAKTGCLDICRMIFNIVSQFFFCHSYLYTVVQNLGACLAKLHEFM